MSEHTKGPWISPYLDTLPNGSQAYRVDSAQPDGVSCIALLPTGDGEITAIQKANGLLIAAAPELLAALESLLIESEGLLIGKGMEQSFIARNRQFISARAAIAKARGQS